VLSWSNPKLISDDLYNVRSTYKTLRIEFLALNWIIHFISISVVIAKEATKPQTKHADRMILHTVHVTEQESKIFEISLTLNPS